MYNTPFINAIFIVRKVKPQRVNMSVLWTAVAMIVTSALFVMGKKSLTVKYSEPDCFRLLFMMPVYRLFYKAQR